MELYYKDLISEEASLEKLVDDLTRVVQGADEFVAVAAAGLPSLQKDELFSRVQRLTQRCRQVQQQAAAGIRATDKLFRANPYSFAGLAFAAGLLAGFLFRRKS